MVSRAKIKELMNESACSHSKDKKPGEGCDKPKPGLAIPVGVRLMEHKYLFSPTPMPFISSMVLRRV